jgi:hypothetical protein
VVGLVVGTLAVVTVGGKAVDLRVGCLVGSPAGPGAICLSEQPEIDEMGSNRHSASAQSFALIPVSPD